MVAASIFARLAAEAAAVRDGQDHVRTQELLNVCREMLPVLDRFGTSFVIVRSDVGGNINRLAKRQAEDPGRYSVINAIIEEEVSKQDLGSSSCTKGLLWLKRAMEFVVALLKRLHDDQNVTLATAANEVYYATLYKYHGWITSSAFVLALKLVPSREVFFEKLGTPGRGLMNEMYQFISAFSSVLAQIQKFLADRGLDDPAKV
ncbi:hypothetical protein WJX84_000554 [Apatococcus fuscideae]|uniref:Glycolipid transfer protein domain-containing protein n=1 Tax=Apatococcus fuscideae TaxID=2026836 RepID=A0AAW1TGA0_9CHLO